MTTRRTFIEAGLALVIVHRPSSIVDRQCPCDDRRWTIDDRRSSQVAADPIRYAALARPVSIPLQEVMTPWHPVSFVAEAMAPPKGSAPARRVLINGVLFRRASGAGGGAGAAESIEGQLAALCVTCPHEQCQVDLVTDQARLRQMSRGTATHPLFECGCHLSLFDAAADGARISGETPRGLYRFRITSISQSTIEITEVEEVALFEV